MSQVPFRWKESWLAMAEEAKREEKRGNWGSGKKGNEFGIGANPGQRVRGEDRKRKPIR